MQLGHAGRRQGARGAGGRGRARAAGASARAHIPCCPSGSACSASAQRTAWRARPAAGRRAARAAAREQRGREARGVCQARAGGTAGRRGARALAHPQAEAGAPRAVRLPRLLAAAAGPGGHAMGLLMRPVTRCDPTARMASCLHGEHMLSWIPLVSLSPCRSASLCRWAGSRLRHRQPSALHRTRLVPQAARGMRSLICRPRLQRSLLCPPRMSPGARHLHRAVMGKRAAQQIQRRCLTLQSL